MKIARISLTSALLAAASMGLSGCLGSGNGGGGGGGGGGGMAGGDVLGIRAELNDARADLVQLGGTPNLRESGTAAYQG